MNKALWTVMGGLALGILCSIGNSVAAPIGHSNEGIDYIVGSADLKYWWTGVYLDTQKRDVSSGASTYRLQKDSTMGYLGYSYADWWLIYGLYGKNKYDVNGWSDSEWSYGAGMRFHLLDHIVKDPTLMEDKLRLNMIIQYTRSHLNDWYGKDYKFDEYYGSIILSVVNDLEGNKLFLPDSLSIFAGPVWSDIKSGAFEEKDQMGYVVGMEFYYSTCVSFDIRAQYFDTSAFMGGLNIHL